MKAAEWKWLIGAALLLAIAFILQSGLLAYAMYVLLGMMLLSRLLARDWLANVTATRNAEGGDAEIGDERAVRITLTNTGKLPIPWVLLEDLLPSSALKQRPPRLKVVKGKRLKINFLRPGHELELKYRVQFAMRGYYQLGPLVIESGDLFGLHRRHRVETDPVFVTVYPQTVPVTGYDIASRRPIGDVRLMLKLFEDPTRIAGVRTYELGDPLNRIHWRATARTGQLHSKVYEPTTLAGATILLDFHSAGYPTRGEPQRSELAVVTAASLGYAVAALNQPLGLCTNGRDAADRLKQEMLEKQTRKAYRTRQAARDAGDMLDASDRLRPMIVPTRRGPAAFPDVREVLARVELSDGLPFPQFVLEVTPRLPRDATVIAVLPTVTVEAAVVLGSLRQQGYAVTAVLVLHDDSAKAVSYGRLWANGVRDVRAVNDLATLGAVCGQPMGGETPYEMQTELV